MRTVLAVSALALGASAQRYDGGWGEFYYPDEEGLQFWRGDTINVTYGCNYTEPALYMVCSSVDPDAKAGYRIDDIFIDIVPPRENNFLFEMNETLTQEDTECWLDMRRDIKQKYQKGDSFASLPFGVWMIPKGEKTRGETTLEPTSTEPASSTETTIPATTTATVAAEQTTEEDDTPDDGSLSQDAQIGIGVGVTVGGLGLMAAGVAFWLLRRRRGRTENDETAITKGDDDDSSKGAGGFVEPKAELDTDTARAELAGDREMAELDSPETKKELPGSTTVAEMESPRTVTELSSPATVSPETPRSKMAVAAPVELPA
ncbi:hypothetical protein LIA77_06022 [Sarocladium implicatum]|nr:hypothetical protein LIA77_06022 [Sarocladium implicatum]